MKDENINLVSSSTDKKVNNYLVTPSFWIFAVVFLIGAVLLIISLYLQSNLSKLEIQAQSIRSQTAQMQLKKEKILVASERLSAAKGILASRSDLDQAILSILSRIPPSFLIDSISADNDRIEIGVISQSLSDFSELFETDIPEIVKASKNEIKNVKLGSFTQAPAGYSAQFEFIFNPEAIK